MSGAFLDPADNLNIEEERGASGGAEGMEMHALHCYVLGRTKLGGGGRREEGIPTISVLKSTSGKHKPSNLHAASPAVTTSHCSFTPTIANSKKTISPTADVVRDDLTRGSK